MNGAPLLSIISVVEAMRREGESLMEAAERLLVEEAMYREGSQKAAAKLLGMSPRVMNYHMEKLGARPKDLARYVAPVAPTPALDRPLAQRCAPDERGFPPLRRIG